MGSAANLLDRVAIALAAALFLGGALGRLIGLPEPSDHPSTEAFAAAFALAHRAGLRVLFPLGAAASIVTLLAMLGHGAYGSRRGRLQILAVALFSVSGFVSASALDPAARAMAAGTGDPLELAASYRGWATASVVIAAAIVASVAAAARSPRPSATGVAALPARQRTLLFLLGTATLFHGYDNFVSSMALPYIARDLGASERDLGLALAAIRIGALLSIVLGRAADRRGRRSLLVLSVLAYTVATAATGLSTGLVAFVACQLVALTFLVTELSIAQVVIAEEFPPHFRARGQGLLGAFDALGAGVTALLFPMLLETALGWRGLYFVGIVPLLLIAWLRRTLPETARFEDACRRGETQRSHARELFSAGLRHRILAVLTLAVAEAMAVGPAFSFASYHATNALGFDAAAVSMMVLLGGGVGLAGWFVLGELAERIGRRPVCAIAFCACAAGILLFYRSAWLQGAFALLVFAEAGARIALSSLGTELFPTRVRSTAKAWITNAGIVGVMAGLAIVGMAAEVLGGSARAVSVLALLPVVSLPALLLLPEPRGRELEERSSAALRDSTGR